MRGKNNIPQESTQVIRHLLKRFKRLLLYERPFGLGKLGEDSVLRRPRILWGRDHIFIGNRCLVLPNCLIHAISVYGEKHYESHIQIGDDVYIGRNGYLVATQGITISDGCVLSDYVYITDAHHGFDPRKGLIMKQELESKGPVIIGANCFLGYRTVVMPGVSLGEWCIVGANSVVTRSFPAYSMIAGSPARLIKIYSHELRQWVSPRESKQGPR